MGLLSHPCFTYEITKGLTNNRLVLKPTMSADARYLRFDSPNDHIDIAELIVMSGNKTISYRVIEPATTNNADLSLISDRQPATHLRLSDTQRIVVDFAKPIRVDSIIIVPRNDDNFVWPGDNYELLAHYGAAGWKSLGEKMAADTVLMWDVPDNALLLLRNRTRGREEQPFIMRDGMQWFTMKFRIKPFSWAL